MTRLTFPQDRTTYVYQGAGQPILTPQRTGIEFFADSSGLDPADLRWPDGTPVGRSTVYTGDDGLIPEFLGPDGARLLYAQVVGTVGLYPVEPRVVDLVTDMIGQASFVSGHGAPTPTDGALEGFYLDVDAKALWGPKGSNGLWPTPPILIDQPVIPLTEFTYHIAAPTTDVTFQHPLSPYPSVIFLDPTGEQCFCDVSYPSASEVSLRFGLPTIGTVRAFV